LCVSRISAWRAQCRVNLEGIAHLALEVEEEERRSHVVGQLIRQDGWDVAIADFKWH
jgi:hypothetical protein